MRNFTLFIFLFISVIGYAQQPPLLNSYSYTNTEWELDVCIDYEANDTGTVLIQFQLAAQETGNMVLDQYFSIPAVEDSACFHLYLPYSCRTYIVTMNMSNASAFGPIQNPLFTFVAGCTSGVEEVENINYEIVANGNNIQVSAREFLRGTQMEVYDITGKIVLAQELTSRSQNFELFSSGLHLVKLKSPGAPAHVAKVVIR